MDVNTGNSSTRDEALNNIINKMNRSSSYSPLAYKLDGSGCSCCLSEYFYLLCKINYEYKLFCYYGYINYKTTCAIIRCTCEEPFIWINIKPVEHIITDSELKYFLSVLSSIDNDDWIVDWQDFLTQQKENNEIYKYNESDADSDDNDENKNYSYYFRT